MVEGHARGAGSCGVAGDGDLVSRLKRVSAEACAGHLVRIAHFGAPMRHDALGVGHVEEQAAMGIGPKPIGDRSLERDQFLRFVGHARSMMREQRLIAGQKNQEQER